VSRAQPKRPETVIGFVGDLHAGSRTAPWPEDLPKSKTWVAATYMTECWRHFCANCPEMDVLFLTGDLIEGKQRKASGTGLIRVEQDEQVSAAIELLEPIVKRANKVIRITGTAYHDGFHGPLSALDRHFRITETHQVVNLELEKGRVLNVAHHPMGGGALYEGTKLDKEQLWEAWASSRDKLPAARWIIRSHLHNFALFHKEGSTVALTPCWQLPTPYAIKGGYWKWQPTLGALFMHSDEALPEPFRDPGGFRFTLFPDERGYALPRPRMMRMPT